MSLSIWLMDKNLQSLELVEARLFFKGWAFFLAIWLGVGRKPILKESKMELLSLIIAGIAVLVTLFREEIRSLFKK